LYDLTGKPIRPYNSETNVDTMFYQTLAMWSISKDWSIGDRNISSVSGWLAREEVKLEYSGLEIRTALYPTKCKQTPPSWIEKCMFFVYNCLLERTEKQIYVLIRFRYSAFFGICCLHNYFLKQKLKHTRNSKRTKHFVKFCGYDTVHVALSIVLFPSNQLYTRFRVNHKLENVILNDY
jgi:hypothetical protein